MRNRRFTRSIAPLWIAAIALSARARADQDSLDGPWATVHADLSGTAATTGIVYGLGSGPIEEKWRLDVIAEGHDRPAGRSSITFDKAGNLYWITNPGGGTGGVVRLVSASPAGAIRWFGNDGAGNVHPLGTRFGGASPVVGEARVYAVGDVADVLQVAAYDKATGKNLWTTDLAPSAVTEAGKMLTPALYKGKLYVVGITDGKSQDVHAIDAETGELDWSNSVEEVGISNSVVGQMAFVPDAFGAGVHGIYFNGDSNNGSDGIGEVYGIQIHAGEATFGWSSDGGKAARSHVIYSEADNVLYTLTWSDYGAQLYAFDPATGFVGSYQNLENTGHGFYDVGALDFDGQTLIGGGFEGYVLRYSKTEAGNYTDDVVYKGGSSIDGRFWGETRVLGQLVQDAAKNSILITGTNSLEGCGSHVIALDVTNKAIRWEFDTGNIWDHQFLYAGGPVMGPDGKIYFFERFNPALLSEGEPPTVLVALGQAATEPKPTAGLILVGYQGREIKGTPPDLCIGTGELIRGDASGSTGKDRTYRYSVEPPDEVEVQHASNTDPLVSFRFNFEGTYKIHLTVENTVGSVEYVQEVCVADVTPVCSFTLSTLSGDPIDDSEDDDEVPCLATGASALADAGVSYGGNLDIEFLVAPSDGVDIDQADSSTPQATITFTIPGIYTVSTRLTNQLGTSECDAVTICVTQSTSAAQLPGDMDQDGKLTLTDAVRLLGHLFLGTFPVLPCEGQTAGAPGPGELALLDVNNSRKIDISDASYILNYLFTGTNGPPFLGIDCVNIPGCPDNSAACSAR